MVRATDLQGSSKKVQLGQWGVLDRSRPSGLDVFICATFSHWLGAAHGKHSTGGNAMVGSELSTWSHPSSTSPSRDVSGIFLWSPHSPSCQMTGFIIKHRQAVLTVHCSKMHEFQLPRFN